METWVFILIAAIFLGIPILMAIYKLIKVITSDKITFTQGDKRITISSHLNAEDRRKLVNF